MKINKSFLILLLVGIAAPLFAQGPPPPPPPSGVPLDGGLVVFLVVSLIGGARYIYKK